VCACTLWLYFHLLLIQVHGCKLNQFKKETLYSTKFTMNLVVAHNSSSLRKLCRWSGKCQVLFYYCRLDIRCKSCASAYSYFKICETTLKKSRDVSFFFMHMKFHTSEHPMKTVLEITEALVLDIKKCWDQLQQGHKHPTQMALILNFNILSYQFKTFVTCQIMVPEQY
jgi:hypothetical protein